MSVKNIGNVVASGLIVLGLAACSGNSEALRPLGRSDATQAPPISRYPPTYVDGLRVVPAPTCIRLGILPAKIGELNKSVGYTPIVGDGQSVYGLYTFEITMQDGRVISQSGVSEPEVDGVIPLEKRVDGNFSVKVTLTDNFRNVLTGTGVYKTAWNPLLESTAGKEESCITISRLIPY